jgi:hypothetical protein
MSDQPAQLRFLVTGTSRSGTTLVQRLTCELPEVWVPQETHFWPHADTLVDEFDWPLTGDDRFAAAGRLLELVDETELPIDPRSVTKQMTSRHRRIGLWTLFESLVAALSPPDRSVLGEKTPNHMFWWEQIRASVPGLKMIAVVRDPADVLRSHRGVGWGEHDAHALAERWIAHQRIALDARRILGPEHVLLLRYGHIVEDHAAVRSLIAAFLDVEDAPKKLPRSLLSGYPLFSPREHWKSRALKAISPRRPAQAGALSELDRAIIDQACAGLLEAVERQMGNRDEVPMEAESLARVRAFRGWQASIAGSDGLPIY